MNLGDLRYPVRVPGEFTSVAELEEVSIREADGEAIRIKDVARVIDGFEEQDTYSRVEGTESLSISLTRRAGETREGVEVPLRIFVSLDQLGEFIHWIKDVAKDRLVLQTLQGFS